MLHISVYGIFDAWRKSQGSLDWERIVDGMKHYLRRFRTLNPELDDFDKLLDTLKKSGLYGDIEVTSNRNKLTVKVSECAVAGGESGVHTSLSLIDLPCPIALFLGAHLGLKKRPKKIYFHPTIFEEDSSITVIELLPASKYKEKVEAMSNLTKALAKATTYPLVHIQAGQFSRTS
ncbi:MAG: hypothetical protein ACE5PO_05840 [Candidatus Bathyarchaeia archaeon]